MEDLFASGRIANVILAVLGLEAAVIGFYLWRRGETGLLSFVASVLAGGCLVLALRAALSGAGWLFVAIYLLAGLLAHLADLALRLLATRHAAGVSSADNKTRT